MKLYSLACVCFHCELLVSAVFTYWSMALKLNSPVSEQNFSLCVSVSVHTCMHACESLYIEAVSCHKRLLLKITVLYAVS